MTYTLTITKKEVLSTDKNFTMDNLELGDNFKTEYVCFQKADGQIIERNYIKNEWRNCNQTMARLAFQLFGNEIKRMSYEERLEFPICRYSVDGYIRRGIFLSVDEYRKIYKSKSVEYLEYKTEQGTEFVIYCWNVFSTILFVQECLKRFGQDGDKFVLKYYEKESQLNEDAITLQESKYNNPYSEILLTSKNIIFRGAPGTGKTYLAKQIATDIVSNGTKTEYDQLTAEEKEQIGFVQFHPSYDYSDFVEGLRPIINDDESMSFKLRPGVFKEFVEKAKDNFKDSEKEVAIIEKELNAEEQLQEFLDNIDDLDKPLETKRHAQFKIDNYNKEEINILSLDNQKAKNIKLYTEELLKMLMSDETITSPKETTRFFSRKWNDQKDSYYFALYDEIKRKHTKKKENIVEKVEKKNYVFIIDEINRGEISKILGELFFSIDPGYRGEAGAVSTQYANLHKNPNEKFYIPENVYIIGTMNDIDRSVDSFDFAMRRRFRFIEIKANDKDNLEMLNVLGENNKKLAVERMINLNEQIANTSGLNENYQIGAAYFLKLKNMSYDELWKDCLEPLLQDYVRGMYDEENHMKRFKEAYDTVTKPSDKEENNGDNQG